MKKKCIILVAAICVALSACGGQTVPESAPPATAVPTAVHTGKPTIAPTPVVVTMEPLDTPTETPAITPAPTPAPTPAKVSAPPSVEPTAPTVVTPAPEVTPPPEEESMSPDPEPTESLCALPLAPTPTPEGTALPETSSSPEPSTEPGQPPELTPIPELPRPTDEEVLEVYRTAAEAYSWFAGYNENGLMLDVSDSIALPAPVGDGEAIFFRVNAPGLGSMDELRAYLKTLFSDEVVDDLFKNGSATFADGPEGGLYTTGAGRGSDVTKGTVTLTVEWSEEAALPGCTVKAAVQLLTWDANGGSPTVSGEQVYEFPYQKVGDKWVFTQFESIF